MYFRARAEKYGIVRGYVSLFGVADESGRGDRFGENGLVLYLAGVAYCLSVFCKSEVGFCGAYGFGFEIRGVVYLPIAKTEIFERRVIGRSTG